MKYLTDGKLVVVGAAGAIGSNIAQQVLTLGLTPNVTLFDINEKGLRGAAREMSHCAFPGAGITRTIHAQEALDGAEYIITAGGSPRRADMKREDLLAENVQIASNLGANIRQFCPKVKMVVVVFNPSDITGLTILVNSGLEPRRMATLAALDSTRLQYSLSKHFQIQQCKISGCRVYGEHGETMAIFHSGVSVGGRLLSGMIGTSELTKEQWQAVKTDVRQAGKQIIEFRGRSSFQSPAHHAVLMMKAAIDGETYEWPSGSYLRAPEQGYDHILLTNDNHIGSHGVSSKIPVGTTEEIQEFKASYAHLVKLRDEVIQMGHLPAIPNWGKLNPHLH